MSPPSRQRIQERTAKCERTTVDSKAAREKRSAFAALKKAWNSEVPVAQRGGDPMVPYILKFRDTGAKLAGYFCAERNYTQTVLLEKFLLRVEGRRVQPLSEGERKRFAHNHDFTIKEVDYRGAFNLFLALIPHRRFWIGKSLLRGGFIPLATGTRLVLRPGSGSRFLAFR